MDIVHNQLLKLNKKFTYSKRSSEVFNVDPNKITTTNIIKLLLIVILLKKN